MEVIVVQGPTEMGTLAAGVVAQAVTAKHSPVIGVATGSSPLPVYAELIRMHRNGDLSMAEATMFLLDEYVGLEPEHPQSYRSFIATELSNHLDIAPNRVRGPNGMASDLASACISYEAQIGTAGGIDLQILGIGSDGHIAFNEPGSSLGSRTRIKTLTGTTRSDNARFFDGGIDSVPCHVLTQGIATILDARHLLLVACGESKAAPIALAVEGPLTAMVPATALQLHPHATVIVDEAAAAGLKRLDYYREAYEQKPDWQRI